MNGLKTNREVQRSKRRTIVFKNKNQYIELVNKPDHHDRCYMCGIKSKRVLKYSDNGWQSNSLPMCDPCGDVLQMLLRERR